MLGALTSINNAAGKEGYVSESALRGKKERMHRTYNKYVNTSFANERTKELRRGE